MIRNRRRSLFSSFSHAGRGFASVFRHERNIRIHGLFAALALALALLLNFSETEFALVLLASGAGISGELMNAALERYSDIVTPRVSGYVEQVKDVAAASVLVLSGTAAIIGIVLYAPKVIQRVLFFTGG